MTPVPFRPVRLPMYDWPEVEAETRHLKAAMTDAVCRELALAPSSLEPWPKEAGPMAIWTDPGLLVAQTCGYPLTHALSGRVALVGTPHFAAPGCDGATYCSHLVVQRESSVQTLEDLRGGRAAVNGGDSQSGMNTFRHAIAHLANGNPFFGSVTISGGHLASMAAVADGEADVAAVDAVCWMLACQEKPDLARHLRSLAVTASAPGLPYITSFRHESETRQRIVSAVTQVFADPEIQKSRERLGLRGFSCPSLDDYRIILLQEAEARALGCPVLA